MKIFTLLTLLFLPKINAISMCGFRVCKAFLQEPQLSSKDNILIFLAAFLMLMGFCMLDELIKRYLKTPKERKGKMDERYFKTKK